MSDLKHIMVKPNQTLWDVALQEYGSIEGVFDLLQHNPTLELNNDLEASQELFALPKTIKPEVKRYYQDKTIAPASTPSSLGSYGGSFSNAFS